MATIGFLNLISNVSVNGNKQQFEIPATETAGTLSVVTTRPPTDENPTSTQFVSKTILEDGFFLEYRSFLDATKNLTTFGLTKKGVSEPIFVVKDDQTIEFKYTATGTISGSGGGSGGVAQSYVDAQDTIIYNNSKKYTDDKTSSLLTFANLTTALTPYVKNTDLTTTLSNYAKISDMTQADTNVLNLAFENVLTQLQGYAKTNDPTNTLSSNTTIQKDSNNTSQVNILANMLKNVLTNQSIIMQFIPPNGKNINVQIIGNNNGVQTNIGSNTSWFQITDNDTGKNILLGMPLKYQFVNDLVGYVFQSNDLVTKDYVDSTVANNSTYLIPIGASMLIPYDPFSSFTGQAKWNAIKDFIGWGEWRLPGDTISSVTYPLAYQRIGPTVPQMAISTPGGTVTINIINGRQMYVFRVL